MKRPGVSVIEVIVAIGLAAIVIAAIGNLIGATHRLTSTTGKEIQAAAFAREWIEVLPSQVNSFFGCSCGTAAQPFSGTCIAPTCNRTADSQTCIYRDSAGFDSCWTTQAIPNLASTDLKLVFSGGAWQLQDAASSHDQPVPGLTRVMSITDIGSPDIKQVTVAVCWGDNDCTDPSNNRNRTQVTTILTAWKNF